MLPIISQEADHNNEVVTVYKKNRTQFKNRDGVENDVFIKNEFFKNKLRGIQPLSKDQKF